MSNLRNSANYVWSTSFVLGKGATGFVYQGVHKVRSIKVTKKKSTDCFIHTFHRHIQVLILCD